MAAKLLSSSSSSTTPQLLCSFSPHSKLNFKDSTQQKSWLRQPQIPNPPLQTTGRAKKQQLAVAVAMQEPLLSSTSALIEYINNNDLNNPQSLYLLAESTAGYSLASYYTSLGLFVISVPGLWSLIKRSVKSKVYEFLVHFKEILRTGF